LIPRKEKGGAMAKTNKTVNKWEFYPLTPERWDDFEVLFGPNGACAGCWCMWFLMTNKEFTQSRKEGHKTALRTLVQQGAEPGLMAYADGIPAGWVALAPRENYQRLKTSEVLGPVDDQPVWVISCFYIHRDYRKSGLMEKLVSAALEFARSKNVKIVEAFPYDVKQKMGAVSIFSGVASVFSKLGFVEVARRSELRPIMRKTL
jgi:GNAT superfamily N-acetyltransferase